MAGVNSHGTMVKLGDGGIAGAAKNITATYTGNPTIVKAVAHGFTSGQRVTIAAVTGTGATTVNGTWKVIVVNVDYFYVAVETTGEGAGAGTATPLAESFTAIKSCKDIQLPSAATDEIDVTTHDSDGKESMDGDTDYGNVTFDINYDPGEATHVSLRQLSQSKARKNWQAILTDVGHEMWAFEGWVNGFQLTAPVSGVYASAVSIKVTGAPDVS